MIFSILLLLMFIVFCLIFFEIFRENFRKKIGLLYVTLLFFYFNFLSPLYGYVRNIRGLFFNDVWDYYPHILLNYLIALIGLLLGYYIFIRENNKFYGTSHVSAKDIPINFLRFGLFIGVLAFSLWGITSGKTLSNIFLMGFFGFNDAQNTSIHIAGNNYLLLIIEIFIPLLILASLSKMRKAEFIFWLLIVSIVFLSQGFRYRFILLISCFILIFFLKNKTFGFKKIFIVLVVLIPLGFGIVELSQYRNTIRQSVKGIHAVEQNNDDSEGLDIIFASSRNYLAFGSLLKYMEMKEIPFGYGETMFGHIFISLMPSNFFPNNKKPIPPALELSARSWDEREALSAGEAYGGVGGAYVEFGSIGVFFFYFIIGRILHFIDEAIYKTPNEIKKVFYIVTVVCFFKIITRGYLPEFFFTYGFIVLPFVFLKLFLPYLWRNESIT